MCSYMFKLQSPSKYSPFDLIHVSRLFLHCLKQFLNVSIFMLLRTSTVFCFISSTLAKGFPLRTFFIRGNKNSLLGRDLMNWEGGTWGSCRFLVKNCWTLSTQCGRCAHKSPVMKWANVLKESSKNSLKPTVASHNNSSWCTDTEGFLEHTPSGGVVLQGARPPEDNSVFWGPPSYTWWGEDDSRLSLCPNSAEAGSILHAHDLI